MRIAILTTGTRGDVQPYVALALGLEKAGHAVTLSGPETFADWVRGFDLPYVPGGLDIRDVLQTQEGREMISGNPLAILRNFKTIGTQLLAETIQAAEQVTEGTDLILYHPKVPIAVDLAEARNVPIIASALQPILVPTGEFPCLGLTTASLGSRLNRATYALLRAQRLMFAKQINKWRTSHLGLPPASRWMRPAFLNDHPLPVLHAYSSHVLPRAHDWPDYAQLTGYWFLEDTSGWEPDEALSAFLADGPPPVYVGFGSMTDKDPEAKTQIVVGALEKAGCRGVLAPGWGGLSDDCDDLPDHVHVLNGSPHDRLFPLMSAIVHHGGAGTTASAFLAGHPQVVLPYFGDQPFWGERVALLDCGPPPVPQKSLSEDALTHALRAATKDKGMISHADQIARELATEDGVGNAVALIERIADAQARLAA